MNVPEYGTPEYAEYIALRREQAIARLTWQQRLDRHWYWHWPEYATVVGFAAALALIWWVTFACVPA